VPFAKASTHQYFSAASFGGFSAVITTLTLMPLNEFEFGAPSQSCGQSKPERLHFKILTSTLDHLPE